MKTKTLNLSGQLKSSFRMFGIALLCAAAITACVDSDDEEPKTPVSLNPATVSLLTDAQSEITISGGETPYTVNNPNQAVATSVISGTKLTVTGVAEGTATITISGADGSSARLSVTVAKEPAVLINIADLKAKLTSGESVTLPKAIKVKGAVISDADSKNVDSKTLVLQEDNDKGGIIIKFAGNHTLKVGDEAEVTVSKLTLAKENGELVVKDVPVANALKTGSKAITPRETTAAEVIANKDAWNGTLVKLGAGIFIGGSGSYTGTISYDNGTATVKSTFVATDFGTYPVAGAASLTGIVRVNGSDVRIDIRNKQDVAEKGGYVIVEDFSTADAGYYTGVDYGAAYPFTIETDVWTSALGYSPWNGSTGAFWEINAIGNNANDPDASFMDKNRNYARIINFHQGSNKSEGIYYALTLEEATIRERFYGASSVTVVYALSKANNATFSQSNQLFTKNDMTLEAFDPAKHSVKLRWQRYDGEFRTKIESEAVSEQGVWHTFTAKNFYKTLVENQPTLHNTLGLYPTVTNNRGTVSVMSNGLASPNNIETIVVIDKIIWEWDAKPTWAN